MFIVFKVIHVLGVILFLGNITVGVFWKAWADRTKDPRIIANTIDGIIAADRVFTFPGIALVLLGGIGAALAANISIFGTGWVLWGLGLFIISGLAFAPASRAQRLISAVAHQGVDAGTMSWELYERFSGIWNVWGTIALIAPILAAVIMIAKPVLPAFHA
jgi:uncharacterized membrane protein